MITTDDLKEMRYLKMEIEDIGRKIKALKSLSVKSMSPSQRTECVEAVTELIGLYRIRRTKSTKQLRSLIRFMESIEDALLRDVFSMRFDEGLSWENISIRLEDRGWYSEDNLRMMAYRYLKKRNKADEQSEETGPPCDV